MRTKNSIRFGLLAFTLLLTGSEFISASYLLNVTQYRFLNNHTNLSGGGWTYPQNASTSDNIYTGTAGADVSMLYYEPNAIRLIPLDNEITCIQYRVEGKMSSTTGTNTIKVRAYNGSHHSGENQTADISTADVSTIFGNCSNPGLALWGLTWGGSRYDFGINVTSGATSTRTMQLDEVRMYAEYLVDVDLLIDHNASAVTPSFQNQTVTFSVNVTCGGDSNAICDDVLVYPRYNRTGASPDTRINVSLPGVTQTPVNIQRTTYPNLSMRVTLDELYSRNFSSAAQEPRGFMYTPGGGRMIWYDQVNDTIYQFDLAYPYQFAFYNNTYNYSNDGRIGASAGMQFCNATVFMIADSTTDAIHQYNTPNNYSIQGMTYSGKNISVGSYEATPRTIDISQDGTRIYLVGLVTDRLYQYNLSTPCDLSTAVLSHNISIGNDYRAGVLFLNDTYFAMTENTNDLLVFFSFPENGDIRGMVNVENVSTTEDPFGMWADSTFERFVLTTVANDSFKMYYTNLPTSSVRLCANMSVGNNCSFNYTINFTQAVGQNLTIDFFAYSLNTTYNLTEGNSSVDFTVYNNTAGGEPDPCAITCGTTTTIGLSCPTLTISGSGWWNVEHPVNYDIMVRDAACLVAIRNGQGVLARERT